MPQNREATSYTLIYIAVFTTIIAVLLSLAASSLKERQAQNIAFAKKQSIMNALGDFEMEQLEAIYNERVEEKVVDAEGNEIDGVEAFNVKVADERKKAPEDRRLPLYIYTSETGDKIYIVPVRGSGLWGPIWGFVALKNDFKTIHGVNFDHQSETPGLGAEINTGDFENPFEDKLLFDEKGNYRFEVLKGKGNQLDEFTVDGMSGATVTTKGTDKMIREDVQAYMPYFNKIKAPAS